MSVPHCYCLWMICWLSSESSFCLICPGLRWINASERHGVSNLKDLYPKDDKVKETKKTFKDYEPGYIHVDVKYLPKMPNEAQQKFLFVAIDRATRWVYLEILGDKSAKNASGFLDRLLKHVPFKVSKVLTDNGKEFTDRFCATGEREPTGNHLFDKVCSNNDIEHRLIKPRKPQTNGMVERFNGRIALGNVSPVQALKNWQEKRPDLFVKSVYNLTGLDTRAGAMFCPQPRIGGYCPLTCHHLARLMRTSSNIFFASPNNMRLFSL
ncbi:MAG: Integrase catalytic region [Magnetococcales bacterium]|nr:Integrase catalytic region [Magnetococcales bacterium]